MPPQPTPRPPAGRRRHLRRVSTDTERLLWHHIRDRQLDGAKFRRQHAIGPYILDFYCPERQLAVELDGGQHLTNVGIEADARRTRELEQCGVRVLRFTNAEVLTELAAVLDLLHRTLHAC